MPRRRTTSLSSVHSQTSTALSTLNPRFGNDALLPNRTTTTTTVVPPDQELDTLYDYLVKFIMIGPSGCGKSCLLHRFTRGEWLELTSHTIGVSLSSKIVGVGAGPRRKRLKLQLWDTAGQERFRAVTRSYYRATACAMLVFSLGSRESFEALPTWLTDTKALASPNVCIVLIGNKADVDASTDPEEGRREVSSAEAQAWATKHSLPYLEVSARSDLNVNEAFMRPVRELLTRVELGEIRPEDAGSGVQYGDAGWVRDSDDGTWHDTVANGGGDRGGGWGGIGRRGERGRRLRGTSVASWWGGGQDWEQPFRLQQQKMSGRWGCCG